MCGRAFVLAVEARGNIGQLTPHLALETRDEAFHLVIDQPSEQLPCTFPVPSATSSGFEIMSARALLVLSVLWQL